MDLEVSPSCWGGIWVAESSSENHSPSAPGHCLPKLSSPKVGRPDYWGFGGILKLKPSSYCHWGKQKPPKGDKGSSHCELHLLVVWRGPGLCSKGRSAFVAINKPVLKKNRGRPALFSQEGLNHLGVSKAEQAS